ncbi:unnamed protein product, partial [Mesorhabditis belari]|uniref:EF-hand domain-containing protein n=1 Tax=Mesorhabditis belari TaxID=2138241 RepID=A0AAF3EA96_9BILA
MRLYWLSLLPIGFAFPIIGRSKEESNRKLEGTENSVDLNGDGELSLPEVQYAAFVHHGLSGSVVQDMFKQVDHNHNKYLDSKEFNEIRPLVLMKAENAAAHYLESVDRNHNSRLSLKEAQAYILKEYCIGARDVERVWKLVEADTKAEMDASIFSKLRRRIRGMSIRLARQIMKTADLNTDGHISRDEAQAIAFEQEGIGAGDVNEIFFSVDDNGDDQLNAPEFADFERIVRARAVATSEKALKMIDVDNSGTVTFNEAKQIAFEHYGFNNHILSQFFAQADENEDGQLDAVEFAGFRTVIRARAVLNAIEVLKAADQDEDGFISRLEAEAKTKSEDDLEPSATSSLFTIADQNKSGKLDKVELADFLRLVRLSAIKLATDHFKEFDNNQDNLVTIDELAHLITTKYRLSREVAALLFKKVDIDDDGSLSSGEIVDFRHEVRKYVSEHGEDLSTSDSTTALSPTLIDIKSTLALENVTPTLAHLSDKSFGGEEIIEYVESEDGNPIDETIEYVEENEENGEDGEEEEPKSTKKRTN